MLMSQTARRPGLGPPSPIIKDGWAQRSELSAASLSSGILFLLQVASERSRLA